jgi:hypothetical protein
MNPNNDVLMFEASCRVLEIDFTKSPAGEYFPESVQSMYEGWRLAKRALGVKSIFESTTEGEDIKLALCEARETLFKPGKTYSFYSHSNTCDACRLTGISFSARETEMDQDSSERVTKGLMSNIGHGHVYPRADRVKVRCGGPGLCTQCSIDAARKNNAIARKNNDSRTTISN